MATRCGDIDPSISWYLQHQGKSIDEVYNLLNKKSGLLGISGLSEDIRPIIKVMRTNPRAKLALKMFAYRVKKYIGAYAAVLGKVDAVVFTGGLGTHVKFILSWSCPAQFKTLVIPTDEEKMIALETKKLVK